MDQRRVAEDLIAFIDASPSPYHCVAEVARRLDGAGFRALSEAEAWSLEAGARHYVVRGDGSIVAFRMGRRAPAESGFRLVGAHTDSPNLRLKSRPGLSRSGYLCLDVEVYGGAILATWVDRDLSVAGRVFLDGPDGLQCRLVDLKRPLCRIPTVAIHLDRTVNEEGLKLDRHKHLAPALGLLTESDGDPNEAVRGLLADLGGFAPDAIAGLDLCLYDTAGGTFAGLDDAFLLSARLDNQAMCHAALCGLLEADESDATSVIALFDHEEVGSQSRQGAGSPLLRDLLSRLLAATGDPEGLPRALAKSYVVSADMAHAVHPSRADLHDGNHLPRLNGGPVVKTNANQRYATDAETGALFRRLCREADVPVQEYVHRADLPCGSTIGPITAAGLGVRVVDVGSPMLSMHSAREMGGSQDPAMMARVLSLFLSGIE
ncbi:MAG: M18 family aminopeptidase [Deltaproteobacteria bacterium]|nr:MAG: M18 family aminopeptidase [Deltaproteobacteria bacterium]